MSNQDTNTGTSTGPKLRPTSQAGLGPELTKKYLEDHPAESGLGLKWPSKEPADVAEADFDAEAAEGLSDEGHIAAEEAAALAGGRDVEFDTDAAAGLSDEDYRATGV
jgi:hypothetical protein